MSSTAIARARLESALGERLSSTLLLREKAAPLTVSTGVPALDALTGGLPRGALSEITGPASSGRTSVMLAALAETMRREEACALVDAGDTFDPVSAAAAGIDLDRLLWVRCSKSGVTSLRNNRYSNQRRRFSLGRLEQVLKVTDLLLQGGGFGMVVLDLADIPAESVRRIPLTSWFRFRRAVEPTATVLLVIEQEPSAKTCASLVVRLQRTAIAAQQAIPPAENGFHGWKVFRRADQAIPSPNLVSHASLLHGLRLNAEILRSRTQPKPMQPVNTDFKSWFHKWPSSGHDFTDCLRTLDHDGFVSGHDFSRAVNTSIYNRALQAAEKLLSATDSYQGAASAAPQTIENTTGL